MVYQNFDVIMGWNRSEFYALAVGHLADRINGAGELAVMPPDDERLTVETVQWVQKALTQAGYDIGAVDGIFGTRTKRALRDLQKSQGWVADGYLSDETLTLLKAASNSKQAADTDQASDSDSGEQP